MGLSTARADGFRDEDSDVGRNATPPVIRDVFVGGPRRDKPPTMWPLCPLMAHSGL